MVEVQDILRQHGAEFRKSHPLFPVQQKAVRAILACRTSALGAHVDQCDECGYEKISYNSCRNRHCPKCQSFAKEEWIDRQRQNFLNTPYFHVVFTVPEELNAVFLKNQAIMYNLLFKAACETVMELCADKKYLGARPGITAVLHTWGQNLLYHPHLHCVITGGGMTGTGQWRPARKSFFLPVKVLSKKFRGKFLCGLRREKLRLHNDAERLIEPAHLSRLIAALYRKDWITYCKPPFGSAQKVIDYLGRYTHRVAISNNRILKLENGRVTFRWRDYQDGNRTKEMTVTADEFIRRFLLHILPTGFRKIRHYGLYASKDKSQRLAVCRRLTHTKTMPPPASKEERLKQILGEDFNRCPRCKTGYLCRDPPFMAN